MKCSKKQSENNDSPDSEGKDSNDEMPQHNIAYNYHYKLQRVHDCCKKETTIFVVSIIFFYVTIYSMIVVVQ